jgi:hypothetical protein
MGSEYIDESEWFQYEGAYPCLGGVQPVQRRAGRESITCHRKSIERKRFVDWSDGLDLKF